VSGNPGILAAKLYTFHKWKHNINEFYIFFSFLCFRGKEPLPKSRRFVKLKETKVKTPNFSIDQQSHAGDITKNNVELIKWMS